MVTSRDRNGAWSWKLMRGAGAEAEDGVLLPYVGMEMEVCAHVEDGSVRWEWKRFCWALEPERLATVIELHGVFVHAERLCESMDCFKRKGSHAAWCGRIFSERLELAERQGRFRRVGTGCACAAEDMFDDVQACVCCAERSICS